MLARIPMPGGFESLNVSAAAAVALYAATQAAQVLKLADVSALAGSRDGRTRVPATALKVIDSLRQSGSVARPARAASQSRSLRHGTGPPMTGTTPTGKMLRAAALGAARAGLVALAACGGPPPQEAQPRPPPAEAPPPPPPPPGLAGGPPKVLRAPRGRRAPPGSSDFYQMAPVPESGGPAARPARPDLRPPLRRSETSGPASAAATAGEHHHRHHHHAPSEVGGRQEPVRRSTIITAATTPPPGSAAQASAAAAPVRAPGQRRGTPRRPPRRRRPPPPPKTKARRRSGASGAGAATSAAASGAPNSFSADWLSIPGAPTLDVPGSARSRPRPWSPSCSCCWPWRS